MCKLLVLLVVVAMLIMIECIREIHTFKVTHYEIQSPKLKNGRKRKIILLSDLHNYNYGENNERLLNAIKAEKPDLILVAGDMIVGNVGASVETAKNLMTQLPKICDIYYANGNHEQRMKEDPERYGQSYFEYKDALIKSGVRFLENEKEILEWEQNGVEIYGVEIPVSCYKKFQKVTMPSNYMESYLGRSDDSKYRILIAHNPIFMDAYLKWGADLVLSGHLHGGVARVPFWRGVITPQGGLFPKYSGEMTKIGNAVVVVSKGIGIHTIPLRFLNLAEIVVLHIGGVEE